jgi:NDP-sugar pyrophosphorylase family protein
LAVIDTAVILVGGKGTRLGHLTAHTPKAMLPIGGRPLLAYLLDALQRAGVVRVVLACGYRADDIRNHFGARNHGLALEYVVEPTPLGTGGALRLASQGLDRAFVAVNGDQLLDVDLQPLARFHTDRSAKATLLVKKVDDPLRYGVVELGPNGRVVRFVEKPSDPSPEALVNAGVYIVEPTALEAVRPGEAASFEQDVLPGLVRDGSVFGLELPGYWLDVGTPESYARAGGELETDSKPTG